MRIRSMLMSGVAAATLAIGTLGFMAPAASAAPVSTGNTPVMTPTTPASDKDCKTKPDVKPKDASRDVAIDGKPAKVVDDKGKVPEHIKKCTEPVELTPVCTKADGSICYKLSNNTQEDLQFAVENPATGTIELVNLKAGATTQVCLKTDPKKKNNSAKLYIVFEVAGSKILLCIDEPVSPSKKECPTVDGTLTGCPQGQTPELPQDKKIAVQVKVTNGKLDDAFSQLHVFKGNAEVGILQRTDTNKFAGVVSDIPDNFKGLGLDAKKKDVKVEAEIVNLVCTKPVSNPSPSTSPVAAPPTGGLPVTGANVPVILGAGAAIIVAGTLLIIGARRRRSTFQA